MSAHQQSGGNDTDMREEDLGGNTDSGEEDHTDSGEEYLGGDTDSGEEYLGGDTDSGEEYLGGDTDIGEEDLGGDTDIGEEDLGGDTDSGENMWFKFERRSINKPIDKIHGSQVMQCACKRALDGNPWCWDRCSNEGSRIFCDDSVCLGKNKCSNLPFEQRKYLDVYTKETGTRGKGLFTKKASIEGTFVAEYVGFILNAEELAERLEKDKNEPDFYIMQLDTDVSIDARFDGNLSRFINSSCNPNCECIKFVDSRNEETRVGIFTIKDLEPNTELTFDYNVKEFGKIKTFYCKCGECEFKQQPRARKRHATCTAANAEAEARNAAEEKKVRGAEQTNLRAQRARQRDLR
jgi:hypothetical protein